jgi:tetratricopeptide (TPR) repeat protein/V8-like Glu-specific endopeptidase
MLSKLLISTTIVGTGGSIAMFPSIAIAKTSVEIGNTARAITVLITGDNHQGSGVIIQQQGDVYTILTAAHVIKKPGSYKVTTSDDRQYQLISNSIRRMQGIDLAVVKFQANARYSIAKLGNCNLLQSGMDLYVAGFPLATKVLTESVLVFREGKVSANSNRIFEDGYSLIYSNDTLPGMSGGAVLNADGELVAIHGRGDREESSDGNMGQKTGFNVGIPINRFATVAQNLGLEFSVAVTPIPQNTALKSDDYIASGRQKYGKKDYLGALADYNSAIQLNPNMAAAYNYRGGLRSGRLKDYPRALADYNSAIQLEPKNGIFYSNRGHLKEDKLSDIKGAFADYNLAIQLSPDNAIAYANRGYLKAYRLRDYQGGLADLDRAIVLNPYNAISYNSRGAIKSDYLTDYRGGLADLERAIGLNPNDAIYYNNRGLILAIKLKDMRGYNDFNRAIELDPNLAIAYSNRGIVNVELRKEYQMGLVDFNRAINLDPKLPNPFKHRGVLKVNYLADIRGGLADIDRAIQLQSDYAEAYHVRGKIKFERLKDRSGAIADLQQATKFYQQQGSTKEYQATIAYLNKIDRQ